MARPLIAITHDGCTWNQAEIALPVLQELGIRASFFAEGPVLLERIAQWKESGMCFLNGALLNSPSNLSEQAAREELDDLESLLIEVGLHSGARIAGLPFGTRTAPELDFQFRIYARLTAIDDGLIYAPPAWDTSPMELLSAVTEWSHAYHVWGFADVGAGDNPIDLATYRNLLSAAAEDAEFVTLPELIRRIS